MRLRSSRTVSDFGVVDYDSICCCCGQFLDVIWYKLGLHTVKWLISTEERCVHLSIHEKKAVGYLIRKVLSPQIVLYCHYLLSTKKC